MLKSKSRGGAIKLRRIDVYLITSFIGPFIVTFFVTLFVLFMQFLFVYVDDLIGKGLEWTVVTQLLIYALASFVPLALPLAIMLASMMTIGNLGEQYELTSLKSSGVSLWRIIRSLILFSILLSIAALLFSNYALPVANLKFQSLMYDIRQQRPAINIKQGVFYNEIDGYSIRAGRKDDQSQVLYDVLIYDHTRGKGSEYVITAKSGRMFLTEDKRYLILELFNGEQYEELSSSARPAQKYEQVRVGFKEWRKVFDLSEFALNRTDEGLFKENYRMLNLRQLQGTIDTAKIELANEKENAIVFSKPYFAFRRFNVDSVAAKNKVSDSVFTEHTVIDSATIVSKALNTARNMKSYIDFVSKSAEGKIQVLRRFEIEWWRKLTLSFACFVLFLIGASLGAIIRKGGFGLPFVISIILFVIFYILSIAGEKMAREGVLSSMQGMWFASMFLLPLAIFLMYKANHDSILFNTEAYKSFFQKIFKKKNTSAK